MKALTPITGVTHALDLILSYPPTDSRVVDVDHLFGLSRVVQQQQLECGPMPNVMVTLPNIGGALCSTPQSLADAHY